MYTDTEIAAAWQRIESRESKAPDGYKIDISDGLPYMARVGFSFGREFYGYYQCSPSEIATALLDSEASRTSPR